MKGFSKFFAFLGLISAMAPASSSAGVFNMPHFVLPGEFAIGIEPEVVFDQGGGVGLNAKYTHGLTEMNNVTGIIGLGSGPRNFRAGGNFTFDFFPDVDNQPGIGLAVQGLFVQLPAFGSVEITGIPYIHKSFKTTYAGGAVEPFFALPLGLSLANGQYTSIGNAVVGAMLLHNEHLRSSLELGISLGNSYSYISGGLIYYH